MAARLRLKDIALHQTLHTLVHLPVQRVLSMFGELFVVLIFIALCPVSHPSTEAERLDPEFYRGVRYLGREHNNAAKPPPTCYYKLSTKLTEQGKTLSEPECGHDSCYWKAVPVCRFDDMSGIVC